MSKNSGGSVLYFSLFHFFVTRSVLDEDAVRRSGGDGGRVKENNGDGRRIV